MATKSKARTAGGRQPDYDLAFIHKVTNQKGRLGAAWSNPDGSIRIVLNPMVVIPADADVVLTLFKRSGAGSGRAHPAPDTEPTPF